MVANERQVGGNHYGGGDFMHWDWVLSIGLPYLEAHATKYLARWPSKGAPLQDLEKALHFIDKIKENVTLCMALVRATRPERAWVVSETTRLFATANVAKGVRTRSAINLLATWTTIGDLDAAADHVRQLIVHVKAEAAAKPVPLEDSNKHALYTEHPEDSNIGLHKDPE